MVTGHAANSVHNTTDARAQHILERGFDGGLDSRQEGTIHLTPHPGLAADYAKGRVQKDGGGTPAVLRVEQVRGVSAEHTAFGSAKLNREAGADYMDKGPEVLVLNPSAMHGITRHASAQASPVRLYHGTTLRRAQQIAEQGFRYSREAERDGVGGRYWTLTSDPAEGRRQARDAGRYSRDVPPPGEPGAVVEMRVPAHHLHDQPQDLGNGHHWYAVRSDIPPEHVRGVTPVTANARKAGARPGATPGPGYVIPKHPDLIHRVIHEREWNRANVSCYFEPSAASTSKGYGGWHPSDRLMAATRPVPGYAQDRGPHRVVTFDRHQHGWQLGDGYHEDEVAAGAEVNFVNHGRVPVGEAHAVSPPLTRPQLAGASADWHARAADPEDAMSGRQEPAADRQRHADREAQ